MTIEIIIHRGTKQIGGCLTEIRTEEARIFIDLGSELPDIYGNTPPETLSIDGVTQAGNDCDGVFFTHYHGDHIGMISLVMPHVPSIWVRPPKRFILRIKGVSTVDTFRLMIESEPLG